MSDEWRVTERRVTERRVTERCNEANGVVETANST
jgi:hypothetical protein